MLSVGKGRIVVLFGNDVRQLRTVIVAGIEKCRSLLNKYTGLNLFWGFKGALLTKIGGKIK